MRGICSLLLLIAALLPLTACDSTLVWGARNNNDAVVRATLIGGADIDKGDED